MSNTSKYEQSDLASQLSLLLGEADSLVHTPFEAWSDKERDDLRWTLVRWRDSGRLEDAVEGLSLANRIWEQDPIFLLELLVIEQYNPHLVDGRLIEDQTDQTLAYPPVMLFLALRAVQAGRLDIGSSAYDVICAAGVECIHPFYAQYYKLAEIVLINAARERLPDSPDASGSVNLKYIQHRELFTQAIGVSLISAQYAGELSSRVRDIAFVNTHAVQDPIDLCLKSFDTVIDKLNIDGKLVYMRFLQAIGSTARSKEIAHDLLADEDTRNSAQFARIGSTLAARRHDAITERLILARYQSDTSQVANAHDVEVSKRRKAVAADRPLNVFVGLYGQLRDPRQILQASTSALIESFENSPCGPFQLHFGLSAWSRPGRRPLTEGDSVGFYQQSAPTALHPLTAVSFGTNGRDLALTFPNLVAAMVAHNNAAEVDNYTESDLKPLFPAHTSIALASELPVEAEVRQTLAAGRSEAAWSQLNQFKMWARIAGLKQSLLEQEAMLGHPVDACLFLRCDLTNLKGQLAEAAVRVASAYDQKSVLYDYDGHAEFVEGAGDRYMVMSRTSADVILDGYANTLAIHATTSPQEAALRARIGPHEGLASLLFKSGLTPEPISSLYYEIHRGAPPTPALQQALEADLEFSTDPRAQHAIRSALQNLAN